jgi:uncharacterized protein (TIGR02246 family)
MRGTRILIAVVAAAISLLAVEASQRKREEPQKTQSTTLEPQKQGALPKQASPPTEPSGRPQIEANRDADEDAIRASVDAFEAAYNVHDAKAIADLFTNDAKIVTEDDDVIEGREAIEQVFAGIFEEEPASQIEVSIASVRFIGSDLAVEAGSTKTIVGPGETPEYGRYTVLHIKREGKWQMALARDTEGEPATKHERLQPLAWLIGDWIDESPDSQVKTTYRWADNQNFILGEFSVRVGRQIAMSGTTRIGWDAMAKQIRSWTFDSEGGFVEGLWSRNGDQWTVKNSGVTDEGEAASATNIITYVSNDRATFQSHDRIRGGESMPDVEEIPIVRMPPKPGN